MRGPADRDAVNTGVLPSRLDLVYLTEDMTMSTNITRVFNECKIWIVLSVRSICIGVHYL